MSSDRHLEGQPEDSLELIQPSVAAQYRLKLFPAGTVLFAKSGMSATKGHIYQLQKVAYVVNHLAALVPTSEANGNYLRQVLRFKPPASLIKDEAYPSIRLQDIEAMEIPVPQKSSERERIAAILDQADVLRRKRRKISEQVEKLRQSIFVEYFGDPIRNTRNWPALRIDDFVEKFESGKNIVAEDVEDPSAPYRVLKISSIGPRGFDPSESKALPRNYKPPLSHFVKSGDLLISRANTTQLVGRVSYIRWAPQNIVLPDKLWRLVWSRVRPSNPRFIEQMMMHPSTREALGRLASGTSGSMQNISQEKLRTLMTIFPPFELQTKFGAIMDHMDLTGERIHEFRNRFDDLFATLQHRAFHGML